EAPGVAIPANQRLPGMPWQAPAAGSVVGEVRKNGYRRNLPPAAEAPERAAAALARRQEQGLGGASGKGHRDPADRGRFAGPALGAGRSRVGVPDAGAEHADIVAGRTAAVAARHA